MVNQSNCSRRGIEAGRPGGVRRFRTAISVTSIVIAHSHIRLKNNYEYDLFVFSPARVNGQSTTGPNPHTRNVRTNRSTIAIRLLTHRQLTRVARPPQCRPRAMGACIEVPSATDRRLSRALAGLHQAFAAGPAAPAPPALGRQGLRVLFSGASVVVCDLVLLTLLTLLLLLPAGEGPVVVVVIVVVPVVHDLTVALDVVGCRDDLVLAHDDCARGRVSAGQ